MYAIVDIETTGGYGTKNCITEIAIILHNGKEVEGNFNTLVNPESPINWYVQNMTGITNKMVADAPKFKDIAEKVYNLIKDRIFVAHNVNFDYSFVKQHLKNENFEIDLAKICTVKLSRKIFPGLPKYGLGSLSKHFNIENIARHRAIGDATATSKLFEIIIAHDTDHEVEKLSKKRNQQQYLPPNLINTSVADAIPSLPGVYYFYNNKEKIIYVGKAVNLKKRIKSHFSNNKTSKQKQDFLKEIFNIKWTETSSELTAQIFESTEIKKYWPKFNKSQKYYERKYGIFMFEDAKGYNRLAVDTKKKVLQPLLTFGLLVEARQFLKQLCDEYDINPTVFFLSKETLAYEVEATHHNNKIENIIGDINKAKQTFLINDGTGFCILIEKGIFIGMGKLSNNLLKKIYNRNFITKKQKLELIEKVKQSIELYPENFTVLSYINNYAFQNPESMLLF